jgi:predicted ATP-dependent endonuclease of OLD family
LIWALTQNYLHTLLVGENNSGKTSVLEAIQLLSTRSNLEPLSQTMFNRGEVFRSESRRTAVVGRDRELDMRHLFYGHELALDNSFRAPRLIDLGLIEVSNETASD